MGKFIKVLVLPALAIGIGIAVSKVLEMKQDFMAMSEDEQREFIGNKVPEDKLIEIQDGIVKAVSAKTGRALSTS